MSTSIPSSPRDSVRTPTTPRTLGFLTRSISGTTNSSSKSQNPLSPSKSLNRLARPASIYTLGRSSFASQLSQLTSVQLSNAASLSARIPYIPTATAAASALSDAANQIKVWIPKASDVLRDLDADDDVEWAAAAGREGIEEMAQATAQFEALINSYVGAIEHLQTRSDVSLLAGDTLTEHVIQLETIVKDWQKVKDQLEAIKLQEDLAIEWLDISDVLMGDAGREIDALGALVFQMEERRHQSSLLPSSTESAANMNIDELASLVQSRRDSRLSSMKARGPSLSPSTMSITLPVPVADDSSLVALFARMQPLRASLDFLPIRLSTFNARGRDVFPTACDDLESSLGSLELQFSKLKSDAEGLRKELGEDKWVVVFRNAGRQAQNMFGSIERTLGKLKDAIRRGKTDYVALSKMMQDYQAKKAHYVPAVEKVLNIIDRGVMDRLTVNGEILQLQSRMKHRWAVLQSSMTYLDAMMAESQCGDQLRDSVSSVLSEHSLASSSDDTRKSSPASSIVSQGRKGSFNSQNASTSTPTALPKSRIPRTSMLTPTTGLGPFSRQSATSPSRRRSDVQGDSSMGLGGYWQQEASPDIPPLPTFTPSPRKYSSQMRPTEGSRYASAGAPREVSPSPRVSSFSAAPRVSVSLRSVSSFGIRSPSMANALGDSKTQTPTAGERLHTYRTTPMTARRNASFASLTHAAVRPESEHDSGRLYPPSASRLTSRPSTSHGFGPSGSSSTTGRRSSLANTARGLFRSGAGDTPDKPRWRF